jgi:hypothetical protein
LVFFYDIDGRKEEVLFDFFCPETPIPIAKLVQRVYNNDNDNIYNIYVIEIVTFAYIIDGCKKHRKIYGILHYTYIHTTQALSPKG